jgi:hypothetical protein
VPHPLPQCGDVRVKAERSQITGHIPLWAATIRGRRRRRGARCRPRRDSCRPAPRSVRAESCPDWQADARWRSGYIWCYGPLRAAPGAERSDIFGLDDQGTPAQTCRPLMSPRLIMRRAVILVTPMISAAASSVISSRSAHSPFRWPSIAWWLRKPRTRCSVQPLPTPSACRND